MTYSAIAEYMKPDGYTARILGWPTCTVAGATKGEEIRGMGQALAVADRGIA